MLFSAILLHLKIKKKKEKKGVLKTPKFFYAIKSSNASIRSFAASTVSAAV